MHPETGACSPMNLCAQGCKMGSAVGVTESINSHSMDLEITPVCFQETFVQDDNEAETNVDIETSRYEAIKVTIRSELG